MRFIGCQECGGTVTGCRYCAPRNSLTLPPATDIPPIFTEQRTTQLSRKETVERIADSLDAIAIELARIRESLGSK
jgi:hypothetical protein